MTDQEVNNLNKNIIKMSKKIKRLEIRDNILAIGPGAVLVTGVTFYTLIDNSALTTVMFPYTLMGSIALGMIPLSKVADMDSTGKYKEMIKDGINMLHEEALQENIKIMQKKLK